MVVAKAHGGGCCGARHLQGFGTADERNPDLILVAQREVPPERMTEVILNGTQVARSPRTLRRLADIGYVLTSHYINGNHGSHNYVFQRCDRRLPLVDAEGRCVIPDWDGPVLTPRLQGNLGALPVVAPVISVNDLRFCRPGLVRNGGGGVFTIGSRVQYVRGTARRHGMEGTLTRPGLGRETWYIMWDGVGYEEGACAQNCLELVAPAVADVPNLPLIPLEVGQRVVWSGVRSVPENGSIPTSRPAGGMGTISRLANLVQRNVPEAIYVRWDNPSDTESGNVYYYRNQLTVLTPEEAAANPVIVIAEVVPEFVATRHAPAVDAPGALPAPIAATEAPPLLRIVYTTFHNVYRDGRVGAGYDTYAAAREARRGDGRIDRRDVYNNGAVLVEENCPHF